MAQNNDPNSMVGDFKNLYKTSGLIDAIPNWCLIQDRFPFEEAEASTGQFYVFGVVLQKEQGFTYAPSSGTNSGAVPLNPSIAGFIGQAMVQGYAIYLRSRLSYDAAAKASRAGKKAFAQAYGAVLKNMKESHQYRLELSLLYGQYGIGIVQSVAGQVISITNASWANGTWASGMSGATLDIWSTQTLVGAVQHATAVAIQTVNVLAETVTIAAGGVITAVVPGDVIYFQGARTATAYNECPGLYAILSNSGANAGVLFNIDASLYDLWAANQYAVNGNLSLTAIFNAAAVGMSFGLHKGMLLCSPDKFAQLASDEASLRRYIENTPKTDRGVKGISFMMGSVDIEIVPHPLIQQGSAMLLAEESIHRCGATDITMGMPGTGQAMEVHVTDLTALEVRAMSDQGVYSDVPAQNVLLTGIV